MAMPTDVPHQDFGAIEAAVKETARGRAFLASYARRVQNSDTLTLLAILGRLERFSAELASRIAEIEAGSPSSTGCSTYGGTELLPHHSVQESGGEEAVNAMHRIDELSSVLGDLHRHAVQLAGQYDDSASLAPPDLPLLPPSSASERAQADEDVLGQIVQALER